MGIMQLINIILFWLFFGLCASHFAKKRGRRPVIWFSVGLFLGIFGILLLFLLPKVEKKPHSPPAKPLLLKPQQSDAWLKMWYYLDPGHSQQGPFEFPDLIKTWKQKGISEASYIWGEGMQEWKRLAELPDLKKEIEQA